MVSSDKLYFVDLSSYKFYNLMMLYSATFENYYFGVKSFTKFVNFRSVTRINPSK